VDVNRSDPRADDIHVRQAELCGAIADTVAEARLVDVTLPAHEV
jgi:hypothetical protein